MRPTPIAAKKAPEPSHGGPVRRARPAAEAASLIGQYDHVTRLPNRLGFLEDYVQIAGPRRYGRLLLMVTLADARHYNDILRALGHAFAEDFVRAGATKLAAVLPRDTPIYHCSVLSFAFVFVHDHTTGAPALAKTIASAFSGALRINQIPIKTRVGIGLLALDAAATDAAEALRAALAAAQDSRRLDDGWAFYNYRTDATHIRAFRILADLPAAITAGDQLSLRFPAAHRARLGPLRRRRGAAALAAPRLGTISPTEFTRWLNRPP